LQDPRYNVEGGKIHNFLADPKVLNLLKRFDEPYAKPSQQTRSSFEELTSAINVAPTWTGKYDIKQIKEDALWLSKETGLDEVHALRYTVLELQLHSEDHLLQGSVEADDTALGLSLEKSSLLRSVLGKQATEVKSAVSQTAQERRVRLLHLFLGESQHLAKVRELVVFSKTCSLQEKIPAWLSGLGGQLLESWNVSGGNLSSHFPEVYSALERDILSIRSGCPWVREDDSEEDLQRAWTRKHALDMLHRLRTMVHIAEASDQLPSAGVLTKWFEFLAVNHFFVHPDVLSPSILASHFSAIQSLAIFVSLSLIKVEKALGRVEEIATQSSEGTAQIIESSYLGDSRCIPAITRILGRADADAGIVGGPIMVAWVSVVQGIRAYSAMLYDRRENGQVQRAIDGQGQDSDGENIDSSLRPSTILRPSSTASDASQQASLLEVVTTAVDDLSRNEDLIKKLAVTAFDGLGALDAVYQLAVQFCNIYGSDYDGQSELELRRILLGLLSAALIEVGYSPEIVEATLAVLEPKDSRRSGEIAQTLLDNPRLRARVFDEAVSRFPLETTPFLALSRLLAKARTARPDRDTIPVLGRLQEMTTITTRVAEGYAEWTIQSDNDLSIFELNSPLEVFSTTINWAGESPQPKQMLLANGQRTASSFEIPSGTHGDALNDGRPFVVRWSFRYSGLKLIGLLLQLGYERSVDERSDISGTALLSTITEIIGMLTELLQGASHEAAEALSILEECSDSLGNNRDVISLIFEMYEQTIYQQPIEEDGLDFLLACTDLMAREQIEGNHFGDRSAKWEVPIHS